MLSIGTQQQPSYTVTIPILVGSDFGVLGHLWSQNDVNTLWSGITQKQCQPFDSSTQKQRQPVQLMDLHSNPQVNSTLRESPTPRAQYQHRNTSRDTPSLVWPASDLIPILQQIAALPCRQPSKPLFAPHTQVWWRPIKSPASPK